MSASASPLPDDPSTLKTLLEEERAENITDLPRAISDVVRRENVS